ncbi:SAVED domain-containing protein [Laribacter hongkongensis]|uniref:SAVED domain-containing protein n=1 Tax=Laribacter hongkongensis TaxID=168471 RepID=UPI001EFDDDE9|nr:SAVED domain-containing protein [Laribacter hongkongensis]MCG9057112.1 SAVED domain-containing protein [Laribacter hongkongensis]MCG9060080.1 SAVED domain-containing protein [Laribacter hongkongensis]MCG9087199.1 SAVED domain-containing protein [Laribacter hongkongensis]
MNFSCLASTSPATSSIAVSPGAVRQPDTLDDNTLCQWLERCLTDRHTVVLVHASHRCKVFDGTIAGAPLLPADPEAESAKFLKKLARANLLKRIELPLNELVQAVAANAAWLLLDATPTDVGEFLKRRAALFGQGRGQAISETTSRLVWHEAGGRCMYRGCSEDLGRTTLTTKAARIGYLAHIVASDPDGPRGNSTTSHALSNDPENIMLMCDAHHRLIDRIDEDGHSAELLREMRRERSRMVRNALDGLAYPRAQALALFGNVANIPTVASERSMREAMYGRRLAPLPDIAHVFRRTQRDDRLSPDFWDQALHEHEPDFRELVRRVGGQPAGNGGINHDTLAVFPFHSVPLLVLCGRIVGEACPIEVFQYHRHRNTWQWDPCATPLPSLAFQVSNHPPTQSDEVLLSLELTALIDERAIPNAIAGRVRNGEMPWVRVTARQPDGACIGHPDDLEQFTTVARTALRLIQDGMRPSRVHLLGVSPVSTLFRFGQLLQAGHHPAYVVYDRPDRSQPFKPALSIEGQQVTSAVSPGHENRKTIPLR